MLLSYGGLAWDSSPVAPEELGLLFSRGRSLGVPLKLQWGTWGSSQVATGYLGL